MKFTKLFAVAAVAGSMMSVGEAKAAGSLSELLGTLYTYSKVLSGVPGAAGELSAIGDWMDTTCAGEMHTAPHDPNTAPYGSFQPVFENDTYAYNCLVKLKGLDVTVPFRGKQVNVKSLFSIGTTFICGTWGMGPKLCNNANTQAACLLSDCELLGYTDATIDMSGSPVKNCGLKGKIKKMNCTSAKSTLGL